MLPPQVIRGPVPRGVCWAWRKGFCARGPDCIYRHEETPHTRSDNRICRWEYATKCHSHGSCGQKHLQLTVSGVTARLDYFRSFGRGGKDLTQRDLAELLRVAMGLFVDGDQELRFLVVSTLSSGWHLEQMKLCLHPSFLFQPYPPQISWQDHVVPLLRIMSDPVNTIHEPSMESLRNLYRVALDPRRHAFWHRVMKFIEDSLRLYPFRVASQITGVITIMLLAIKFDEQNLKNSIVRESVPLLVRNLEALQDIYQHGYLAPVLSEALNTLKLTVAGRLPIVEAMVTVTNQIRRGDRPRGSRGPAPDGPEIVGTFGKQKSSKLPVEPLEQRLLALATDNLMAGYLRGLSGHTVNGGLIAGMGFVDNDDIDNQQTGTEDLEEELEKIPYSHGHHGDIDIRPNPGGIFSIGTRKNVAKPMIFTNDAGNALFQRWKERAADPAKLNFDWGKHANTNSMKDFLQLTLTLFVSASPGTRLQFISGCLLKDEYLGKLWECLNVKLPTDGINHPSPKYSDHVSTIIYIMSHPDVVGRREFNAVRKELSGMFVSIPNYLYGILEYMKLHSRSKAKNTEMIEACVKGIVIILEGVFKLTDPRNIPMEFRYEAKEFVKFAISVENTIPWANRTDSLTTEAVQSFMRADEKLFPDSNPPKICGDRQKDQARERALIARGTKMGDIPTNEMDEKVNDRIKSGHIVIPVDSYLDEKKEAVKEVSRQERRLNSCRRDHEEGWNDGTPIIHRTEHDPQDKEVPAEEAKEEFEKEAQPMNDTEALQYLQKIEWGPEKEKVLEAESTALLHDRAPLGERDFAAVDRTDNVNTFDVFSAYNWYCIGFKDFTRLSAVWEAYRYPSHLIVLTSLFTKPLHLLGPSIPSPTIISQYFGSHNYPIFRTIVETTHSSESKTGSPTIHNPSLASDSATIPSSDDGAFGYSDIVATNVGASEKLPSFSGIWGLKASKQKKRRSAMDEEPFRNDGGSVFDGHQTTGVKTCSRFPKQGPNRGPGGDKCSGDSVSLGSPPNCGSVLTYMSQRGTSVPLDESVLQRLYEFQTAVQIIPQEAESQDLERGGYAEKAASLRNNAHTHRTDPWEEAGTESQPRSNESVGIESGGEYFSVSEPLASHTNGVRFGPRPRDKATADYYRAIHGTGYPKFHLDDSNKTSKLAIINPSPRMQAGADDQETDRKYLGCRFDMQVPDAHHRSLSARVHQASSEADHVHSAKDHLAENGSQVQGLDVEQMMSPPAEAGHTADRQRRIGRELAENQLAAAENRELQPTLVDIKEPKIGRATAPPVGTTPKQEISQGRNINGSTILNSDYNRVSLPPRPLATSNKDQIFWPNPQLEAAEAERGRPIARLTSRHDQGFLPRRLSEIRNPNELKEYLPCGHTRGLNRSESYCNERVSKKTPYCGHEANVECSNPMRRWQCKIVCGASLPCSHYCRRECFQCLYEIKIDNTPVWNHSPCQTCMKIHTAEEKRRNLEGKRKQTNASNVADRAQALE
ncbi:hypothetical protein TWF788_007383 [Orbilia oligospora]|uniref:C3H1-type domain-containing protein n=1 Tax=Orbilia oligospora TaxID=2813651 RepID=A0A7C8TS63_ORBOL|nr:hypothetical protein TWF788_007383 [Orbilia oligospora]